VAADVAEGADLAVVVADDEYRLVANVDRQVRAGSGEVRDVPGELPCALEDRPLLEADDLGLEVEVRLQGGPSGARAAGTGTAGPPSTAGCASLRGISPPTA
jgi:hypothetical protein